MNEPQTVTRPPKRPLTGWIFLLPVLLLGGALFAKRGPHEQPNQFAESALPPAPTSATETTPTSEPTTTFQAQPHKSPIKVTLFLPSDDGKLHRRTVQSGLTIKEGPGPDYEEQQAQTTTQALNLLLKQGREFFPKGTRLTAPVQLQDGGLAVSLNRAFETSEMWQSEEATQQAVYAIVNTAAATDKTAKSGVRLLIEGKPIQTLGEFDASDAIEPNTELVAK